MNALYGYVWVYMQGSQLFRRPKKVSFRRLKETNFEVKRRPKGDHFRGKRRLAGLQIRIFLQIRGFSIFKEADPDPLNKIIIIHNYDMKQQF